MCSSYIILTENGIAGETNEQMFHLFTKRILDFPLFVSWDV